MKRISVICLLLFVSGILTVSAAGKNAEFTGVVIAVDKASVMVKHNDSEKTFNLTADTKVIVNAALKKSSAPELELCQTVKVLYAKKGSSLDALTIEILKESDCYQ